MTEEQVIEVLSGEVSKAGSAQAWGAQHGIQMSIIYAVLAGRRRPTPAILDGLNIVREVRYRRTKTRRSAHGA